jgi:C-terminal peptidase prc
MVHVRQALGGLLALVLLPSASPATVAEGASGQAQCPRLRPEHRVSYRGGEEALFRRVVELVEDGPDGAPATEDVLRTFVACAARMRERVAAERQEAGGRVGPSAFETVDWELAPDGSALSVRAAGHGRATVARGDVVVAARRIARQLGSEIRARERDDLGNLLWFLWIESYLGATGQPHNSYDYADELVAARGDDRGRSFGVGFELDIESERALVSNISDARLREAGLAPGDELIRLDGRPFLELSAPELQRYRWSPAPFPYVASIRNAARSFNVAGQAVPIRHATISWSVRGGTGYVRIRRFAADSLIEWRRALRGLEAAGVRSLILDLRGNPGGTALPELVDVFFKPGNVVVSYRDRRTGKDVDVGATVEYTNLLAALLVDRESASMSEVLVAAFQTHGRGPVVGETTFGKAVGQSLYPVHDEGRLHLVERTYFFPGTRETWDGRGIAPNVAVAIDEKTRRRIQERLDDPGSALNADWEDDPVLRTAAQLLEDMP